MKKLLIALIIVVVAAGTTALADKPSRKEARAERQIATARMVDSLLSLNEFIFVAERAVSNLPSKPYITLNGGDDIYLGKEKLVSALPFYGYLYSAPIGSTSSPLSFTSEDFSYKVLGGDKKKNLIEVKVKNSSSGAIYTIVFEVFDNATAVANITMSNGSSSMFFGYIKPIKHKK